MTTVLEYKSTVVETTKVRESVVLQEPKEVIVQGGSLGISNIPESYETVNRNLRGYSYVISYLGDLLQSITYTWATNSIIKTFNYTGDILTSITLSGNTPGNIKLTKTFNYLDGKLVGIAYS